MDHRTNKEPNLDPLFDTTEKILDKHAVDIGRLVIAWNSLCDVLSSLFSLIATPQDRKIGNAIWHAIRSDRNQRRMLDAAARIQFQEKDQRAYQEIRWGLERINEMQPNRNDAVHAPYSVMLDLDQKTIQVVPVWFDGHPNATRLKDKDLKEELLSYKADIDAMANFFRRIETYIVARNIQSTLPERPAFAAAALAPTPRAKAHQSE